MHVTLPLFSGTLCIPSIGAKGDEFAIVGVVVVVIIALGGDGGSAGEVTEFVNNAEVRSVV